MNPKQQRHDPNNKECKFTSNVDLTDYAPFPHPCTCTERVEVDQKRFEELIAKAITPPQEPLRERKHDCEWTHDEIMGCTICASGYMSFEDFKKRVDYHSWRITDLREQLASSRTAVIARMRAWVEKHDTKLSFGEVYKDPLLQFLSTLEEEAQESKMI